MIPPQTAQILLGAAAALFYAVAVAAIGTAVLRLAIGRPLSSGTHGQAGLLTLLWLGFVMGQGITSMLWLALGLAGLFYPPLIWTVCVLGWLIASAVILLRPRDVLEACGTIRESFLALLSGRLSHACIAVGLLVVLLLRGAIALLPTNVDDALQFYLVTPNIIAIRQKLELQPFLFPYYGLQPLQVEMHWAALFAIANETAVNVWDYLCALSFLAGVGFLAWAATSSRRVAIIAAAMMLSTPGFFDLMGGGKTDNAAAQYGIAAFLWLFVFRAYNPRAMVMAGLCAGWAIAGRFTNFILVPGLIVIACTALYQLWRTSSPDLSIRRLTQSWLANGLMAGLAAGLALAPMLVKNWLLIGCPLAPIFGCQGAFSFGTTWIKKVSAGGFDDGFSVLELLSYPFVWTLGTRPGMVGRLSPLFIGFLPLLFLYYRSPSVRSGLMAGLAGVIGITTWWLFLNDLFPFIRWMLVPLGLCAVLLSTGIVAAERDLQVSRVSRWLLTTSLLALLFFFLFQSRAVVYAVRYIASIDDGRARYEARRGYDLAMWLNARVQPGERVAGWGGYSHLLKPDVLLNSESTNEFEWLWERCRCRIPSVWTGNLWHFYAERGFTYIVIAKNSIPRAIAVLPDNIAAEIPFVGGQDAVLRISKR
ncbi:MAG: hypothetical protein ACREQ7_17745 [Candidatus Binatia bacterium]